MRSKGEWRASEVKGYRPSPPFAGAHGVHGGERIRAGATAPLPPAQTRGLLGPLWSRNVKRRASRRRPFHSAGAAGSQLIPASTTFSAIAASAARVRASSLPSSTPPASRSATLVARLATACRRRVFSRSSYLIRCAGLCSASPGYRQRRTVSGLTPTASAAAVHELPASTSPCACSRIRTRCSALNRPRGP